jgi:hypothetical protein
MDLLEAYSRQHMVDSILQTVKSIQQKVDRGKLQLLIPHVLSTVYCLQNTVK